VVSDLSGQVIWRREDIAERPLAIPFDSIRRMREPAVIHTAEGEPVIVVGSRSDVGHDQIHGLNAQTGEVLWSRGPVASLPTEKHEGKWNTTWQAGCQGRSGQEDLLLVCWWEGVHYPTAIEFCRTDGSVQAIYYHPGFIYLWAQLDGDGDGLPELLFYGVNNSSLDTLDGIPPESVRREAYPAAILVLDGPTDGQAYPYLDWDDIPIAEERAYILVPPFDPEAPPDITELSCSADMEILLTFKDRRRLHLDPILDPTHYLLAPWADAWLRIRDRVTHLPVHTVSAGRAERLELPVNEREQDD
jgi:hypothetical protein